MSEWKIRPVEHGAIPAPPSPGWNGIYEKGRLIATVGNYNHIGSEPYVKLIAAAPALLGAAKIAREALFYGCGQVGGGGECFMLDDKPVSGNDVNDCNRDGCGQAVLALTSAIIKAEGLAIGQSKTKK